MSTVKISRTGHFHHENKTWLRLLEFFKQENYFMKTRLAEVVDNSAGKDFLALAEQFQNKFIVKDEFIDELRHDINKQERMLSEKSEVSVDNTLIKTQGKLRNEMDFFEKDFNTLKNEFNKYLSSIL